MTNSGSSSKSHMSKSLYALDIATSVWINCLNPHWMLSLMLTKYTIDYPVSDPLFDDAMSINIPIAPVITEYKCTYTPNAREFNQYMNEDLNELSDN